MTGALQITLQTHQVGHDLVMEIAEVLTRLTTVSTPMVRITTNIHRITSGLTAWQTFELAGVPQFGPPPGLATQHVRLPIGRQQHTPGGLQAASFDGVRQHLQLLVLQLLEQLFEWLAQRLCRRFIGLTFVGLHQPSAVGAPFTVGAPSAPEHEHETGFPLDFSLLFPAFGSHYCTTFSSWFITKTTTGTRHWTHSVFCTDDPLSFCVRMVRFVTKRPSDGGWKAERYAIRAHTHTPCAANKLNWTNETNRHGTIVVSAPTARVDRSRPVVGMTTGAVVLRATEPHSSNIWYTYLKQRILWDISSNGNV